MRWQLTVITLRCTDRSRVLCQPPGKFGSLLTSCACVIAFWIGLPNIDWRLGARDVFVERMIALIVNRVNSRAICLGNVAQWHECLSKERDRNHATNSLRISWIKRRARHADRIRLG